MTVLENKEALVEHLRKEHEILEIAGYAAATMLQEENRDFEAQRFFSRLEMIRSEMAGTKRPGRHQP